MEFKEFRNKIIKNSTPKKARVRNSWGVYSAYKAIRKNHWFNIGRPLKEGEFYSIIRGVNKLLAENIVNGETVVFPSKMGKLEIRKFKNEVYMLNGNLCIGYPVNWIDTIKLWHEDEEAKDKKILIRYESPYMYRVYYNKYNATYENKMFYRFTLNRFIRRDLSEKIKQGKIDTLW